MLFCNILLVSGLRLLGTPWCEGSLHSTVNNGNQTGIKTGSELKDVNVAKYPESPSMFPKKFYHASTGPGVSFVRYPLWKKRRGKSQWKRP